MALTRKSPFDPHYIAIVDYLADARAKRGLKQSELGDLLGQSQVYISRIELKQRRLDVWEFVQVCRALGLDPAEVLKVVE